MKAVVVSNGDRGGGRRKVLVDDWPDPGDPSPTEVRTVTLATGVTNGTERNDLLGGNYAVPEAALPSLGIAYQNVGCVQAVGANVADVARGDLVFSSSPHAEFALTDHRGLLTVLPPGINKHHAALLGMSSVALRVARRCRVGVGRSTLVVGAGFVGQMIAQMATLFGSRVAIADLDVDRLAIAQSEGWAERIIEASGSAGLPEGQFDVVVDAAGVPGMEDSLITAAAYRGAVAFVAGRSRVSYDFNAGQHREIEIVHSSHFDRVELEGAARMMASGRIRVAPLLTDVVAVDEAETIYATLKEQPSAMLGTVFQW